MSAKFPVCGESLSKCVATLITGVIMLLCPEHTSGQSCSWSPLTSGEPLPRTLTRIVYDSTRGVTVLFGGTRDSQFFQDTWELEGAIWYLAHPGGQDAPPARSEHAMAYDSRRQATVVFGGQNGPHGFLNDTWEWNGATWRPAHTGSGQAPSPRWSSAMAYDSSRGVSVLFGGYGGSYYGDTWEWDGSEWRDVTPVNGPSPSPRDNLAMAFDEARGVTVLFGGYDGVRRNDTWEWDGGEWHLAHGGGQGAPGGRNGHALAYDSNLRQTLLFGGWDGSNYYPGTWGWNGQSWQPRSATGPSGRTLPTMAYDSLRRRTIMCGGYGGSYDETTWSFTCEHPDDPGSSRDPVNVPPPRIDTLRSLAEQRGLLFGAAFQKSQFSNKTYKAKFRNCATLATFENAHKAESIWTAEGTYNWAAADEMVEWCYDNGLLVKFHTLVWDNPVMDAQGGWSNQGVPQFLIDTPHTEQQIRDLLRDYIYQTIRHYSGNPEYGSRPEWAIQHFDVVNEYLHDRTDIDGPREFWWKVHGGDEIFTLAYQWASEAAAEAGIPNPVMLYNDFDIEAGGKVADLETLLFDNFEVIDNGWLDGIGFQSHLCDRIILGQDDLWLDDVEQVLNYFSSMGLRLFISEFDAPGAASPFDTYYNYAYFCMSHPFVEGFQMWNWWDGDIWYHDDWETGCDPCDQGTLCAPGIYDEAWDRKPTYRAMEDALRGAP